MVKQIVANPLQFFVVQHLVLKRINTRHSSKIALTDLICLYFIQSCTVAGIPCGQSVLNRLFKLCLRTQSPNDIQAFVVRLLDAGFISKGKARGRFHRLSLTPSGELLLSEYNRLLVSSKIKLS